MSDTDARFVIDGGDYAIPTLDTFTMDEAQILYDYANCVVEDFAPAHPEWDEDKRQAYEEGQLAKVRNPAFKRALVHVAYQRVHPDATVAQVREIVGRVNLLDVTRALLSEDDAGPPETGSPTEPSKQQPSETLSRPEGSGSPSTNGSDAPAKTPVRIGTSVSVTSSPPSILERSAS